MVRIFVFDCKSLKYPFWNLKCWLLRLGVARQGHCQVQLLNQRCQLASVTVFSITVTLQYFFVELELFFCFRKRIIASNDCVNNHLHLHRRSTTCWPHCEDNRINVEFTAHDVEGQAATHNSWRAHWQSVSAGYFATGVGSTQSLPNLANYRDSFKKSRIRDYKPGMWNEFFAEKEDVTVDEHRTFRIYRTKQPEKPGPVLLLLHGGGYSALTWAHFCVSECEIFCWLVLTCTYIHLSLRWPAWSTASACASICEVMGTARWTTRTISPQIRWLSELNPQNH